MRLIYAWFLFAVACATPHAPYTNEYRVTDFHLTPPWVDGDPANKVLEVVNPLLEPVTVWVECNDDHWLLRLGPKESVRNLLQVMNWDAIKTVCRVEVWWYALDGSESRRPDTAARSNARPPRNR